MVEAPVKRGQDACSPKSRLYSTGNTGSGRDRIYVNARTTDNVNFDPAIGIEASTIHTGTDDDRIEIDAMPMAVVEP